jgi:choline dehydrogenase
MGRDSDPAAVLLPDLCVRGTAALRAFDASMMPNIVSGNTNAAVLAVAARAVDIMMGIAHLPPRVAARPRTHLEAQST